MEARRHQREAPARVGVGDDEDRLALAEGLARRDAGRAVGQDRGGTLRHRVLDEAAAVQLAAGQGGEEIAGLHLPRIRGDAENFRAEARREHGSVVARPGRLGKRAIHQVS